jgi:hypothetical protein
MTPNLDQPSPGEGINPETSFPADTQAPKQAASLRLSQIVDDALRGVLNDQQITEYLATVADVPKQPTPVAAESERCIELLEEVVGRRVFVVQQ